MSIMSSVVSSIDMLIHSVSSGFYKNLKDYCFIETASDKTTLIGKDGTFITVFSIFGSKKYVGDEELDELERKLSQKLSSTFKKEGHKLQFVFTRDIDRVESELKKIVNPYWKAAKSLNLDLDDLFEGKINHLKN